LNEVIILSQGDEVQEHWVGRDSGIPEGHVPFRVDDFSCADALENLPVILIQRFGEDLFHSHLLQMEANEDACADFRSRRNDDAVHAFQPQTFNASLSVASRTIASVE
jgi:hypothetical protein